VTEAVVTVGIDVASQPAKTAACQVSWDGTTATVERVENDVDDGRLTEILTEPVGKIGLDVPLGWPDAFVEAVGRHHIGRAFGDVDIKRLATRETDRWVNGLRAELHPLSVSADRIAYPAMRMARILGELTDAPLDRTGAEKIVEVYPAAALRVWGLRHRGYKGKAGRPLLMALAADLRGGCPWLLTPDATWDEVCHTDHTFDALVCALVARAQQRDLCHAIPPALHERAGREGWIAVPLPGSLDRLPSGPAVR
jgi:hypothetical protein